MHNEAPTGRNALCDYDDPCLCESHASARRAAPGTYTPALPTGEDEPVACDVCNAVAMRGAL